MNSDMKLFIYEAYTNGDIDIDTAKKLIGNLDDTTILESQYLSAMNDIDLAESSFMESAISYAHGNTDQAFFEKKADDLGKKIAAAWEKFKKWVKSIWDKITSKFKAQPKDKKIKFPKQLLELLKKADKTTSRAYNGINNFLHNGYGKTKAEMDAYCKEIDNQEWWKSLIDLTKNLVGIGLDAWAGKIMIEMAPFAISTLIFSIKSSIDGIIGVVDKVKETTFAKNVSNNLHRIILFIKTLPQWFSNKPEVIEQVPDDKVEIITDKNKL